MPLNFITVPEPNPSDGIDSRSAESQIQPGYSQDIINADAIEGRLRKRKGYQGYAGGIPVRVSSFDQVDSTNQLCFLLDSSVDLASMRSTPIVVYGRSSDLASGGPFTTAGDIGKYYAGWSANVRRTLTATAGAPPYESISISNTEHELGTANAFLGLTISTSLTNLSHYQTMPESAKINLSTFEYTIEYQNSTGTDLSSIPYYAPMAASAGTIYVSSPTTVSAGATSTISIVAGTHGLANYTIVARVYQQTGTHNEWVLPDSLILNPTTGQVDVTVTNGTGSSQDYIVILSGVPGSRSVSTSVASGATASLVVSNPTSPFLFVSTYIEQSPGGPLEEIIPDSITYDSATGEVTIVVQNNTTTAATILAYYDYGQVKSKQVCVTDTTVTTNHTDSRPQLTIWGLPHSEIYGSTREDREGWVNHLDSYRRQGEERLVAGLGGNLFTSRLRSELAAAYRVPLLYPNLLARTSATRVLGPLLWDTADTPARSRGYITSDSSGTGWGTVSSVAYNAGTGLTEYTIDLPSKLILDSTGTPTTLSSVVSTSAGLEDYLVVQGMSYARHNGTFRIVTATDGVNQIVLAVDNDANDSTDWNDTGTAGQAGVFTDQLPLTATSTFLPGDILVSDAIGPTLSYSIVSSSSTTIVVDGVVSRLSLSSGLPLTGRRTSRVVPLRTALPARTASVENMVVGDMVSYTELGRLLRIAYINPDSNRTISITGDGTTATATLASGTTDYLRSGGRVILSNAGVYTGVQEISTIGSATTFTFTSPEVATVASGTLLGNTVELDEDIEWEDSISEDNSFQVDARWIPMEAPTDSWNLTPATYVHHLDSGTYGNQAFLRSIMVSDNMYLTNGDDEVTKFDGTSIYRAGLPDWQPDCFITQDTTGSTITFSEAPVVPTAVTNNRFTVPLGQETKFTPGDRLVHTNAIPATTFYTVSKVYSDSTDGFVEVFSQSNITLGASPELRIGRRYKYYFRLNAVDENNNIIASATTGAADNIVELGASAGINLRLIGLPAWDNYDYDKLEVQIYRTKANEAAPFYLLTTRQMSFDSDTGYIDFRDTYSDENLINLDVVTSVLKGTELGTGWREPLRARYTTTASNSLVLANIQDYPRFDIRVVGNSTVSTSSFTSKKLTFRRDSSASGTVTDMLNMAVYEWRPSTLATSITPATDIVNNAGASFTVTSIAHGLVAGNWVYTLFSSVATASRSLEYAGWWQVASATADTFTINHEHDATYVPSAADVDRFMTATDKRNVPVNVSTDGNMGSTNGNSNFGLFQPLRRLSLAINASMRKVDTSITGFEDFTPWLMARSGNDLELGQIVVSSPRVETTTPELVMPSTTSPVEFFVNEIRRAASEQISADTVILPSRLLVSYPNYPELFDNPTVVLDTESDSAIDVNPADGQEITGVIPFFGDSAFGASQQAGILVVFKTNSIYLVDINQKRQGAASVQRIESEGLGCTAPYSIAVTKNGIIFANESGIYSLGRDLSIRYIGKYMERKWLEDTNRDYLGLMQGHHYSNGRQYKLSIPTAEADTATGYLENDQVYVYDHTSEAPQKPGAWTRYTNHPATGWANLSQDAFFSSTTGEVYSIRRQGDETDYRDGSQAIECTILSRPVDMGNAGIRKVLSNVVARYRLRSASDSTILSAAVDFSEVLLATQVASRSYPTQVTGMSDESRRSVQIVTHSMPAEARRGAFFQLQWYNGGVDEAFELAGFDLVVAGLTSAGMRETEDGD